MSQSSPTEPLPHGAEPPMSRVLERRGAYERASLEWPMVPLTFQQFSRHLDVLGYRDNLPSQVGAVYLCAACAFRMNSGCQALEQTYFPALRASLVERKQPSDFADEILQQVRERLFGGAVPRIGSYRGTGSLTGWLRRVTLHIAADNRRTLRVERRVLEQEYPMEAEVLYPHASTDRSWSTTCLAAVEAMVHEGFSALDAEERRLLSLFYCRNFGAREIGRLAAIDRATVYRRIRHAERRLRQRWYHLLRTRLGLVERSECSSLLKELSPYINLETALQEPVAHCCAAE